MNVIVLLSKTELFKKKIILIAFLNISSARLRTEVFEISDSRYYNNTYQTYKRSSGIILSIVESRIKIR